MATLASLYRLSLFQEIVQIEFRLRRKESLTRILSTFINRDDARKIYASSTKLDRELFQQINKATAPITWFLWFYVQITLFTPRGT